MVAPRLEQTVQRIILQSVHHAIVVIIFQERIVSLINVFVPMELEQLELTVQVMEILNAPRATVVTQWLSDPSIHIRFRHHKSQHLRLNPWFRRLQLFIIL